MRHLIARIRNFLLKRSLQIVLLGDVSVGKSSIIHALKTNQPLNLNQNPSQNTSTDDILHTYDSETYPDPNSGPYIKPTIGINFENIENFEVTDSQGRRVRLKLQLWDTSGQDRLSNLGIRHYFKGCHGVVIVYDSANEDSFYKVIEWDDLINVSTIESSHLTKPGSKEKIKKSNERRKKSRHPENPATKSSRDPVMKKMILANKSDLLVQNFTEKTARGENLAQTLHAKFHPVSAMSNQNILESFTDLCTEIVNDLETIEKNILPMKLGSDNLPQVADKKFNFYNFDTADYSGLASTLGTVRKTISKNSNPDQKNNRGRSNYSYEYGDHLRVEDYSGGGTYGAIINQATITQSARPQNYGTNYSQSSDEYSILDCFKTLCSCKKYRESS